MRLGRHPDRRRGGGSLLDHRPRLGVLPPPVEEHDDQDQAGHRRGEPLLQASVARASLPEGPPELPFDLPRRFRHLPLVEDRRERVLFPSTSRTTLVVWIHQVLACLVTTPRSM